MDQDNNNKSSSCSGTSMNKNDGNAETVSSNSNDDGGLSNELSNMNVDTTSSSKKKKKNTCLCCLKEIEGLQGCSRCGTARYCDKACQVKHWPVHKNSCLDSNDTEDSNVKLQMKARNHREQGSLIDR